MTPVSARAGQATLADLIRSFPARGEAPALTEVRPGGEDLTFSYRELAQSVADTAVRLATEQGIGSGDRVVTLCRNSTALIVADLAVMTLGAVVVPLDPRDTAAEIGWAVRRVRASLVVSDSGAWDEVTAPRTVPLASLAPPAPRLGQPVSARPAVDDPAVILFSSGSTARPKGVVLTHGNLLDNADSLREVHAIRPVDRHICVLPLFHANAFGFSMVAVLSAGAHLVLMPGFHPLEFAAAVRQYRVNVASLVPELLRVLSARAGLLDSGGTLRYVVSAAAPLPLRIVTRFSAVTGLRVHQGYGLSECTNFATAIRADIGGAAYAEVITGSDPPSIGSALPGCDVEILAGDGTFAPDNVEGEIVVRGGNVMSGYWEQQDATSAALVDGWLRTGDLGYARTVGGERFFFLTGRSKELIIRVGAKISPTAVERELGDRGIRGPMAVVGFPHALTGEEVGLYLERDTADPVAAVATAVRDLPFERRPKVIIVSAASIPRTSTGKIRRQQLKSHFSAYGGMRFTAPTSPVVVIPDQHDNEKADLTDA